MTVKECENRITQLDSSLRELCGEVAAIKVSCEEMSSSNKAMHKERMARFELMSKQMKGITETLSRLEAIALSSQNRGKGTTSSSFETPQVTHPLLDMETKSEGSGGISGALATCENMLRKIDMPVFDGRLPYSWISRAERFFRLERYDTDEKKLDIVSLSLAGDGLTWYKEELATSYFTNWAEFKKRFLARFATVKSQSIAEEILKKEPISASIHETKSVQEVESITVEEPHEKSSDSISAVMQDMANLQSAELHPNFSSSELNVKGEKVAQAKNMMQGNLFFQKCLMIHKFTGSIETNLDARDDLPIPVEDFDKTCELEFYLVCRVLTTSSVNAWTSTLTSAYSTWKQSKVPKSWRFKYKQIGNEHKVFSSGLNLVTHFGQA